MVLIGRLGLLRDARSDDLALDSLAPTCSRRGWHGRRGAVREATLVSVLDSLSVTAMLGHLRASVALICGCARGPFDQVGWFLVLIYLHSLV